MGTNTSKFIYAAPSTESNGQPENETPAYRRSTQLDRFSLIMGSLPDAKTYQALLLNTFKQHDHRPALGTREKLPDGQLGEYQWKTYKEIEKKCYSLGATISLLDLAPEVSEYKDFHLRFIGLYSKNREEYGICEMTAALFNLTAVPIYDTLGPDAVQFVFEQTNMATLFCSENYLKSLIKSAKEQKLGSLKNIVSFEAYQESDKEAFAEQNIKLYSFEEVLNFSKPGENIKLPEVRPEDILCLSYTSGTTANPKAVMLSHSNFIAALAGIEDAKDPCLTWTHEDVHLSYLPSAHIYEKLISTNMLKSGGRIGYYNGDVLKLKDDIQILKPTFFVSVPRLFNKFYDAMMNGVKAQTGIKKILINTAISSKTENLLNKGDYKHAVYDAVVFKKMREAFGGNIRFMMTAAAPMSSERLNFLKIALGCPILEAYGQTESTGASFLTHSFDSTSGHVGGPTTSVEFKLVDIPEMHYTAKDVNEAGEVCPRGEVCLRGPAIFKGYYKDEEKTNEAVDKDGWLHTGDVGVTDSTGRLRIVDRKKNIFKLAQGEYLAPEKIETVLLRSGLLAEVYVYGDSLQTHCVLIAVPNPEVFMKFSREHGAEESKSLEQLCKDPKINEEILKEIEKNGRAEGLHGFEIPRRIYLRPNSFAQDDLLTGTMKLKRNEAKTFCKNIIDQLYNS